MKTELVPEKEFSTAHELRHIQENDSTGSRTETCQEQEPGTPSSTHRIPAEDDLAGAHPFKKPLGALSRLFCVERRNPAVKVEV